MRSKMVLAWVLGLTVGWAMASTAAKAETVCAVTQPIWSALGDGLGLVSLKRIEGEARLAADEGLFPARGYGYRVALSLDAGGNPALQVWCDRAPDYPFSVFSFHDATAGISRYAIRGEMYGQDLKAPVFLQMATAFSLGGGDAARIAVPGTGPGETAGWRPFEIACGGDVSSEGRPTRIDVTLVWSSPVDGAGVVGLRNIRLVQYRPTLSLTPLEQKQAMKWGWIGGIGGGVVGILGGIAGVTATLWRAKRLRREEELRRIVSLDAASR